MHGPDPHIGEGGGERTQELEDAGLGADDVPKDPIIEEECDGFAGGYRDPLRVLVCRERPPVPLPPREPHSDVIGEVAVGDEDRESPVGIGVVRVALCSSSFDDRRPDPGSHQGISGGGGDRVVGMHKRRRHDPEEVVHEIAVHEDFIHELLRVGKQAGDAMVVGLRENFDILMGCRAR